MLGFCLKSRVATRWSAVKLLLVGVVAALAGLALGPFAAQAGDVNPCAAGRPCVTELFVDQFSRLRARWTGDWDAYNVRWENPQLVRDADVGNAKTDGITVLQSAWNKTYRFSVQGCNRRFLQSSVCSPWGSAELALTKPAAPDGARLNGDVATWSRVDGLTFHVELRGKPISGGADVYVTHTSPPDKDISAPAGWRDRFAELRVCAKNPAGMSCSTVYVRASPVPRNTGPMMAPPTTPGNFKAARDGGLGTRITLSWSDSTNEEYYYLTAASAKTGQPLAFPLPAPAPKLGAGSTTFVITGDAAAVAGGLKFQLQACNSGGCSPAAVTTVD